MLGFRFKTDLTGYYHLDTRKPMADAHHPPTRRRSSTSKFNLIARNLCVHSINMCSLIIITGSMVAEEPSLLRVHLRED